MGMVRYFPGNNLITNGGFVHMRSWNTPARVHITYRLNTGGWVYVYVYVYLLDSGARAAGASEVK